MRLMSSFSFLVFSLLRKKKKSQKSQKNFANLLMNDIKRVLCKLQPYTFPVFEKKKSVPLEESEKEKTKGEVTLCAIIRLPTYLHNLTTRKTLQERSHGMKDVFVKDCQQKVSEGKSKHDAFKPTCPV